MQDDAGTCVGVRGQGEHVDRKTEKRHVIMQAAEKLFTSRRFHEITMEDVAEAADVAKGTIYLYFQDKEDLFAQTCTAGLEEMCDLISSRVPEEAPFSEQLLSACTQFSEFFERRHQLLRMMQAEEARMFYLKGGVHDRWVEKRKRLVSAIAGIIARGVAAGQIRDDVPPEVLANLLMGMLRARTHDLGDAAPERRRHEVVVDLFCRGAERRNGPEFRNPVEALRKENHLSASPRAFGLSASRRRVVTAVCALAAATCMSSCLAKGEGQTPKGAADKPIPVYAAEVMTKTVPVQITTFGNVVAHSTVGVMHWLGLDWDEGPDIGGPNGPYRQSLAREIYLEHANRLIATGQAYPCFCTAERLAAVRESQRQRKENPLYDGTCRALSPSEAARRMAAGEPHVIRFKTPHEGSTAAVDLLRGEIRVENATLDDFILVKSDGLALYHLAAMVDDNRMGVTHVLRGSEWLSTLPLHALVVRAFGWPEPVWCHLSVFLKPSGKGKMSKRDSAQMATEGHSIFIRDLMEMGYLPEAIVNWIALMGASFDEAEDVFCMEELIQRFDLKHLNPSPAAISFEKADHFNGTHIRRLTVEDLAARLKPVFEKAGYSAGGEKLIKVAAVVQVRIVTLDDAVAMGGFFFRDEVRPETRDLVGKGFSPAQSAEALRAAREILAAQPVFDAARDEESLRALAERLGCKPGVLFGMMRAAITGQPVSPPLFASMEIVGREMFLARLQAAETFLGKRG